MLNVYLISAETNGKKLYKIGYTKRKVEERIKEFKTGNTAVFSIIEVFNSKWGTKIEASLHRQFNTKKVGGEWFDLDENDLNNYLNLCEQLHNNFEIIENNNTYFIDRGGRF
jgi:exosome complex RNA-binding protein Rrp4